MPFGCFCKKYLFWPNTTGLRTSTPQQPPLLLWRQIARHFVSNFAQLGYKMAYFLGFGDGILISFGIICVAILLCIVYGRSKGLWVIIFVGKRRKEGCSVCVSLDCYSVTFWPDLYMFILTFHLFLTFWHKKQLIFHNGIKHLVSKKKSQMAETYTFL